MDKFYWKNDELISWLISNNKLAPGRKIHITNMIKPKNYIKMPGVE